MPPTKDAKFFTEVVVTTILSLVAASLWIEWIKGLVSRYFENSSSALVGVAITITFLAIFCLQYMFTRPPPDKENKDVQR